MEEYPELQAKVVDLDVEAETPDSLAQYVLTELVHQAGPVEVGWRRESDDSCPWRNVRSMRALVSPVLDAERCASNRSARGMRPSGHRIGRGHRVWVGACWTLGASCSDGTAGYCRSPRHWRVASSVPRAWKTNLAEIERLVSRVEKEREVRATMQRLDALGVEVNYHSLDVRNHEAVCALVDDIYSRRGRLDGVIHGAGVLDDRRMAEKSSDSFDQVFDTKVIGAQALVERLRADTSFVVFFSSVSGAFGNLGQIDLAANDALDKLAFCLSKRIEGRVLSVNWGPWAGTGWSIVPLNVNIVDGGSVSSLRKTGLGASW